MRTVAPAVAGLVVFLAGPLHAQPAPPVEPPVPVIPAPPLPRVPPVPEPPPAATPAQAVEAPALPGGTDVSQPLQPVVIPPAPAPGPKPPAGFTEVSPTPAPAEVIPGHILGGWWDSDEVLVWWPKAHPVPPLATGTRLGGRPVLGGNDTSLLIGNHAIDTQAITGGRFTLGWSLTNDDSVGIEGRYFFLGTRTLSDSVTDFGGRYRSVGLPYVNALTGQEDVLAVARPGQSSALVSVFTSTRVQGAELNGVANLVARSNAKLHLVGGYRFFQVQEGLRIESTMLQYPTPEAMFLKTLGTTADQFSTSNRFSGGQLGLHADLNRGPFYVEMVGKVAVGQNFEVLRIDGQTNLITAAYPVPLLRPYPGGIYTGLSNMGRVTRSAFAVVPEGTIKFGLKGERARVFVGYNFLYLSDAIRPGDQIDRTLNPTQIPLLNGGGTLSGPDRPRAVVNHTDFWVQGIIVGLETRY